MNATSAREPGVRDVGETRARMVDVMFAIAGGVLPREHRQALATALEGALPWLAEAAGAGIHRLNLAPGGDAQAPLLSRRTRLVLRVPRERVADAAALAGRTLQIGGGALQLGAAHLRELLPHNTLYAHFVASDVADEGGFLRRVDAELAALGVPGRPICGRRQTLEAGALQGFSLMLDGLDGAAALRLLESGIGGHRRLGCGLFVPHRSAAAVGAAR